MWFEHYIPNSHIDPENIGQKLADNIFLFVSLNGIYSDFIWDLNLCW